MQQHGNQKSLVAIEGWGIQRRREKRGGRQGEDHTTWQPKQSQSQSKGIFLKRKKLMWGKGGIKEEGKIKGDEGEDQTTWQPK